MRFNRQIFIFLCFALIIGSDKSAGSDISTAVLMYVSKTGIRRRYGGIYQILKLLAVEQIVP